MEAPNESEDEECFENFENYRVFENSSFSNDDEHYYDDDEGEYVHNNNLYDNGLMSWCSNILSYIEDNSLYGPLHIDDE